MLVQMTMYSTEAERLLPHLTGALPSSLLPPCPGASDAVICAHHGLGGAGAVALGEAVVAACSGPKPPFAFLYDVNLPIKVRGRKGGGGAGTREGQCRASTMEKRKP